MVAQQTLLSRVIFPAHFFCFLMTLLFGLKTTTSKQKKQTNKQTSNQYFVGGPHTSLRQKPKTCYTDSLRCCPKFVVCCYLWLPCHNSGSPVLLGSVLSQWLEPATPAAAMLLLGPHSHLCLTVWQSVRSLHTTRPDLPPPNSSLCGSKI